jgi:biotin carboxyl carrier protein
MRGRTLMGGVDLVAQAGMPTPRTESEMKTIWRLMIVVLVVLVCGVGSANSAAAQTTAGVEGEWSGVLGGKLHLVVTITKESDGDLGGTLNSVDQHATLALANVKLSAAGVHFEVPRVGGVYDGKMNAGGNAIEGVWTQTGVQAQPLDLKRTVAAAAVPGTAGTSVGTSTAGAAQTEHTPKPMTVGIDTIVDTMPVAFKAGGQWHLAYELHVSNMAKWNVAFTEIDVVAAGAPDIPLASFSGSALEGMIVLPGMAKDSAVPAATLVPGQAGVVYLWLTTNSLDAIPAAVQHKIKVKIGDYPEAMTVISPAVRVDKNPVVTIASPLDGMNLVAANGPSNTSLHRRALIPVNGHAYISQRYAIDWVEAYSDGKTYQGDAADNKSYKIYGAEIHSVADGVVTEVKDGIPQNVPNAETHAVPITLETIGGNHVIVDIGGGRYAFYAHMQPGSPRVKVGDHVKTGQVLGLVGNTGNSSQPHLHFDICDASSMLACEGLPYAFASFEVTGDANGEGTGVKAVAPAVTRTMEMPAEDEVVTLKVK